MRCYRTLPPVGAAPERLVWAVATLAEGLGISCSSLLRQPGSGVSRPPPDRTPPLIGADLPDHARARGLDEWAVAGAHKMCVGAVVSHGAIIRDVGAPVRAEPDVGRSIEPAHPREERLVASAVAGEWLDLQGKRLIHQLVKVEQLDLMAHFGG